MARQIKGVILLLITTMLWGCSFVAQRASVNSVDAFTFNTGRMCSAFLTMAVVILISRIFIRQEARTESDVKNLILGGLLCGLALFVGIACMQIGIMTTGAGKTGFETALYVIEVPVIELLLGKRPRVLLWICVLLALTGLWFLTIKLGEPIRLAKGDLIILAGTFFFAIQIILMDHFVKKADPALLSMLQFAVGAVLFPICMIMFEEPSLSAFLGELLPMLYSGVLASAGGFTLAAYAQKYVEPTVASLLMSLEGAFAVIGAWVIIHEQMSPRELIGCMLMFVAIIISQLPERRRVGRSI